MHFIIELNVYYFVWIGVNVGIGRKVFRVQESVVSSACETSSKGHEMELMSSIKIINKSDPSVELWDTPVEIDYFDDKQADYSAY